MRLSITLMLIFLFCFAPCVRAQEHPDSLKAEFLKELEKEIQDEKLAPFIPRLERALAAYPDDQLLWAFLGGARLRASGADAANIPFVLPGEILAASAAFEKAWKLERTDTNTFQGFHPQPWLSLAWGSLAMHYYYLGAEDSMRWAFKEGKNRGAFSAFELALTRAVVDACGPNAILLHPNDNYFFSYFYMQEMDHYRKDVTVVFVDLLDTKWYPGMLYRRKKLDFSIDLGTIDTLDAIGWEETRFAIPYRPTGDTIAWSLPPTYENALLLRRHVILLDILGTNEFRRPVYYHSLAEEVDLIGLYNHLQFEGLVYKLVPRIGAHNYSHQLEQSLQLTARLRRDITEDRIAAENIRFQALRMSEYLLDEKKPEGKKLFEAVMKAFPESEFPMNMYIRNMHRSISEKLPGK